MRWAGTQIPRETFSKTTAVELLWFDISVNSRSSWPEDASTPNSTGSLGDGDGNCSDWIEIWNPTDAPVNLGGWSLTVDPADLTKWSFPAITLRPDEYLLVFASGQPTDKYIDAGGFLHSNFELNKAAAGYLALIDGSEQVVDEYAD